MSGNQYRFHAKVVPHSESRTFLNQTSSNYLSTGFSFNIPLQAKDGVRVTKAVVTPPASLLPNTSFTLLPGANEMVLATQDASLNETGASGSNGFVRMRSQYVDSTLNQRHPSLRDIGQYFLKSDLAEDAIANIVPNAQVWKVEFYLGNSATPELAQYYRVPARPLTIAQLSGAFLPDLDQLSKTQLKGMLTQDEPGLPGFTLLSGRPALSLITAGTLSAYPSVHGVRTNGSTGVTLYFRDIVPRSVEINDSDPRNTLINPTFIPSTTSPRLQTKVPCINGLNGDLHCASTDAYLDPAAGTVFLTGVDLKAFPAQPIELAHFLSVLQLLP